MSYNAGLDFEERESHEEVKVDVIEIGRENDCGGIDWKWLAIGGTVALVCGLQTGVIGKALLVGAGQRVARRRRRHRLHCLFKFSSLSWDVDDSHLCF
ncbi:hypothetical protein BUALT_Bualt14G0106600 [Buddleja alternifolia]|uniref:Uncharacterized protein n=1 Tax=Buddleja alternifolia TaxID=168488 RepID=A0AAV6WN76_9LAMI|nr:hypothetical protein BUALT_Bualt14G0106600 [Buddleja alternifolia]